MICLMKLLYYEASGKHLECKKCIFYEKCDAEQKDGEAHG